MHLGLRWEKTPYGHTIHSETQIEFLLCPHPSPAFMGSSEYKIFSFLSLLLSVILFSSKEKKNKLKESTTQCTSEIICLYHNPGGKEGILIPKWYEKSRGPESKGPAVKFRLSSCSHSVDVPTTAAKLSDGFVEVTKVMIKVRLYQKGNKSLRMLINHTDI